jgi:hypothetical protein
VNEIIELVIDAADADRADVWIDLNNNGIKDNGEAVTEFDKRVGYTLGAQTVTVYGKVTSLGCSLNQLTALDVSHNIALTKLFCHNNLLTALDMSHNAALTNLNCYDNLLTALNVSNNTELIYLDCSFNQLQTLDLSDNTELGQLFCSNNQLTALNVSNNTELWRLYSCNNLLTALDVSNNPKLGTLYCFNNKIFGSNMDTLVESLPDRKGDYYGSFYVINLKSSDEQNVCTTAQVGIATGKNWIVRDADNNPYPGS